MYWRRNGRRSVREETTATLTARLAEWGAGVYMCTVERWLRGEIVPWKQDAGQSTWCDRLTKEQGRLDWQRARRRAGAPGAGV